MLAIQIIILPFHAGARCCRVGNGPHSLLDAGLVEALPSSGREINVIEVGAVDAFEGEIGRTFAVKRLVASAVAAAVSNGRFPLVLAGNCKTSLGVHAGLNDPEVGVVVRCSS